MSTNKHKSSEPITLKRSQITLAHYNPRKISPEARKQLKANIKRLGMMGGVIWNEATGNLVGGHQKVSILDEINKYPANDYDITVEKVNLTDKEEKEQNIFLNSKSVQGEFDSDLMANIITDIDPILAGLDEYDLTMLSLDAPSVDFTDIIKKADMLTPPSAPLTKEEVKAKKEKYSQEVDEKWEGEPTVILSFDSFQNKAEFMEALGKDLYDKIIKGEELAERIFN
ncbi:Uncharacterised protein [Sphingobacterium multivorum]|uniref:hypothetical protein n=1 Tax=Sphingobacterium multivorum TaxID=28454 RepID=UPI000E071D27|nr:hypothetical protein [Sphingobacterium multivorum]QQT43378.1 hypothetical protein I6J00_16670 [Sphingobacterium multivorum]SUI98409.1 Uncharacterised protein [Sphingobacterium multivorum]